jgi:uncharacterized protein with LGFP repeats
MRLDRDGDTYVNDQALLGLPTGDEQILSGGGHVSHFQHGAIYWSTSTGAHDVLGVLYTKHVNLLKEGLNLGLPTSNLIGQVYGEGTRVTSFQFGGIYWSARTGAHEVHGAIGLAYGTNYPGLGMPTTDEYSWLAGRRNDFEPGYIYWTAKDGAKVFLR